MRKVPLSTWFGETPIDSSADVDQIKGDDGGIILGHHAFVEHEKVVAMDTGLWKAREKDTLKTVANGAYVWIRYNRLCVIRF